MLLSEIYSVFSFNSSILKQNRRKDQRYRNVSINKYYLVCCFFFYLGFIFFQTNLLGTLGSDFILLPNHQLATKSHMSV